MINYFKHLRRNSFKASLGTSLLFSKVGPWAKLNDGGKRWIILKYSFPIITPFKLKITCKGLTFMSSASTGGGDLKLSRVSSFPLSSFAVPWWTLGNASFLTPLNPKRVNSLATKLITREIWEVELKMKSFDWAKARLETTLISFIILAFLHAFSNVIKSHQVVQITE